VALGISGVVTLLLPWFVVLISIRFLEAIFVIGSIGAFIVLIITLVEDFKVLFQRDK
jgi:hypothetical protein